MKNEFLRHTLSTIHYRLTKSVEHTEVDFGNYVAGNGSRTPAEILIHMIHLLKFIQKLISGAEDNNVTRPDGNLPQLLSQFNLELKRTDNLFAERIFGKVITKRILQGPLADALTHIGQLVMLRRLFDSPVDKENFSIAPIKTGIE